MGTNTECESWRESIFRLLHRRLYPTYMDLPHRKEDRSLRLFSELEKSCRKGNREEDQVLARSDGGEEYFSGQFNCYLQQMGIRREFSCRYTPKGNGVAERKNRSVVEAAWAMLEEKSMPKFY